MPDGGIDLIVAVRFSAGRSEQPPRLPLAPEPVPHLPPSTPRRTIVDTSTPFQWRHRGALFGLRRLRPARPSDSSATPAAAPPFIVIRRIARPLTESADDGRHARASPRSPATEFEYGRIPSAAS